MNFGSSTVEHVWLRFADQDGFMDYPQDRRTVNMLGGFGPNHEPLPVTREALAEVAKEWPLSEHTPEPVAEQLRVSRGLLVHCHLV